MLFAPARFDWQQQSGVKWRLQRQTLPVGQGLVVT